MNQHDGEKELPEQEIKMTLTANTRLTRWCWYDSYSPKQDTSCCHGEIHLSSASQHYGTKQIP